MVIHFIYDITHFNGKFFTTVKDLFFKPGFLSKEYMKGRREKYLHPVRMYVFTSAFFFLLFFSFFSPVGNLKITSDTPLTSKEREDFAVQLQEELKKSPGDKEILLQQTLLKDSSGAVSLSNLREIRGAPQTIAMNGRKYNSVSEYDSLQRLLPVSERDSWFMRQMYRKATEINVRTRNDPEGGLKKLGNDVLHKLPYMLLFSLPLFALLLKLVYIRRKQFYYADHSIFAIHLYIFSFLLLLLVFIIEKLKEILNYDGFAFFSILLFAGLIFYLYKAMRNFYGQRRAKTVLKLFFVSFWSLIIIFLLLALFFFFSFFTF